MSLDFNADPLERMAWMRANALVYWDDTSGLWAITRHEDIQRIEADHETFCSGQGSRPEVSLPSMIDNDSPEHTRRRRLVSSGFTPRRVAGHEELHRHRADRRCDRSRCVRLRQRHRHVDPAADDRNPRSALCRRGQAPALVRSFATGATDEAFAEQVIGAVIEWVEYIVGEMSTCTDPEARISSAC